MFMHTGVLPSTKRISDTNSHISWDAPDTILFNANPYLGAMHTADIYYLFDGTKYIQLLSIRLGLLAD
ncbi:hypothetical protein E4T56_gene5401, partial [Termitomyces sp. T112]